jgi:hypothetical protein
LPARWWAGTPPSEPEAKPAPDAPLSEPPLPKPDAETPSERISLNELSARFGGRALGALLLVFGILCLLPLPPGATTIFGLPLLLLAPQLLVGLRAPWLPQTLRHRAVEMDQVRPNLPRVIRWLRRIESVSRPRLTFLFGPVGQRLIWWNFVASSQARIDQAKADWKAGRMKLPSEDDLEFIPLPEEPALAQPAPKPVWEEPPRSPMSPAYRPVRPVRPSEARKVRPVRPVKGATPPEEDDDNSMYVD